ncbi:MAG TPA: peptidase U32 family protein [Desulfobacteria bacterium]|nr:peptidase U32 family protein [Desulfobacteria bacterium]
MPQQVEILSPVGSRQALTAAVENGADAVYFGVGKFNARRRAENLTREELKAAVEYAHDNGVKVYNTFNILVKNHELRAFFDDISDAYSKGIDGIIIQHISFARLLKDTFPDLRIHMSTQAAITNSYYIDLLWGADRVTLPREFSLAEVREFIEKTGLETEVFVHGALCFCYSGLCLFSSFLGGRSGNRGLCAQPCRKRYNGTYLLSTKDLCLVDRIPEIIAAGVASFKIEGRLRSPRYTALATRVYRLAVDSYYDGRFRVPEQELKDLALEFNREFTDGYLFGATDIIAPETPKNRGIFLGIIEEDTTITLHELLSVGDGVGIWTKAGIDGALIKQIEKNGTSVSGADAGETVKLFIRVAAGDRIYKTSSETRPQYAPLKSKPRIATPARTKREVTIPEFDTVESSDIEILAKVYSKEDAQGALNAGAATVFYSVFAHDFPESGAAPYIPRILNDSDAADAIRKVTECNSEAVLLGNLGLISELSKPKTRTIYLDYAANVFNDLDRAFLKSYGATPIVSPELTLSELSAFKNKAFAVLVHGRPVLMTTSYPLNARSLKDEKGFVFPVRREFRYSQILNSVPIGLFNDVQELHNSGGITKFFFDLTDGNAERIIGLYTEDVLAGNPVKKSRRRKHTRGHFSRGVE